MTKVLSSDLVSANTSSMITALTNIKDDTSTLIASIEAFISDSKDRLMGNGYDAVRTKLSFYVDTLNKQNEICNNLICNIKAANNMLLNYMEGYGMLDDEEIPEIERSIAYLKSLLSSVSTYKNDNGESTITADQIASWNEMIVEFQKLLEKLKGLAPNDSAAFGVVGSVKNDVIAYGNGILGIKLPNFDGTFTDKYNTDLATMLGNLNNTTNTTSNVAGTIKYSGGVVVYSQRGYYDANGKFHNWKYKNNGWGKSILYSGCGPTSLASCLATMLKTSSITPATIASKMTSSTDNDGGKFLEICKQYGLDYSHKVSYSKKFSNGSYARDNLLKRGGTIIIASNMYGSWGGHYVAIVGMDSKGKYIVADPNSRRPGVALHLTESELERYTSGHTMTMMIAPKGMSVNSAIQPIGQSA